jgi:hypothetical protein
LPNCARLLAELGRGKEKYPATKGPLLDLLVADHAGIIDAKGRIKQSMHGLALAWHYHPLAWTVRCGNRKTPIEVFTDDQSFLKAIERRTKLGNAFSDGGLRKTTPHLL